jgi:hypothetical protein
VLPVADCLRAWSQHGVFRALGHDPLLHIATILQPEYCPRESYAYGPMRIGPGSRNIVRWTSCAAQNGPITAGGAMTLWQYTTSGLHGSAMRLPWLHSSWQIVDDD